MRIANLSGRLVVITGDAGNEIAYDVEKNSSGQFGAAPQAIYRRGTRSQPGRPARAGGRVRCRPPTSPAADPRTRG